MQLNPRYGPDPVIVFDGSPAAIAEPTIRQRRRLAEALASFGPDEWAHPSRCDGWSCREVIVHLDSTNAFWSYSISSGRKGEPTELLATFDPVASPAELVAASDRVSDDEVLERFVASTDALVEVLASLDEADWSATAEAPPGHLSVSAVTHHALWDSWIHERDVLLPLGHAADEEPDEVAAALRYAAALGPAFAVERKTGVSGVLAIEVTDPDVALVVEIGEQAAVRSGSADADLVLRGGAVDLLEALSRRRPLDAEVPPQSAWMLDGVDEVFEQT